MVLDPGPEEGVLLACPGEHGDEPPAVSGDVGHRLTVGELGVGHVEEVGPPEQLDEGVPGGDVGGVVVGGAALDAVGDRHRPVGGDGEDPHQLLEIGAVVLVVAEGDRRGRLAAPDSPGRRAVGAREGDRRRVVVQLGAVDLELGDGPQHERRHEARAIGVEQAKQGSADPVVVQQGRLAGAEPEHRRAEGSRPLAERVDGLSVEHQVAHHDPEGDGRRQLHAAILVGHVALEELGHRETPQEVVDDRHGAQQLGAKLEPLATPISRCGHVLHRIQCRT